MPCLPRSFACVPSNAHWSQSIFPQENLNKAESFKAEGNRHFADGDMEEAMVRAML